MNAAVTTVRHPAKDDVFQLAFPKNGGPGLPLASNKAQATETPGFPITRECRVERCSVDFDNSFTGSEDEPAMAAGVSDRLWSMDDTVALIDATQGEPKKRGPYKPRQRAPISK